MTEIIEPAHARQYPAAKKYPEPSLPSVFLMLALLEFDRDAKPRKVSAAFDQEYWRRHWRTRERAREIIEGRRRWPQDLRHWKLFCEVRYFHRGVGEVPPWCDPRNLTRPQREQLLREDKKHVRAATRVDARARIYG
jgi:hypothetical protein